MQHHRALTGSLIAAALLLAACGSGAGDTLSASGDAAGAAGAGSLTAHDAGEGAAASDDHSAAAGAPAGGSAHADGATHTPHWAYEGEAGPEAWGSLSEDWALCAAGAEQSPIDVRNTAAAAGATVGGVLTFAYQPSAFEVVDNGHTIQVNLSAAGSVVIEGTPYQLVQFHAHAPSEHTMDSVQFPMEYHLVHKNAAGNLAVVGVFVQQGSAHQEWAKVFAQLPDEGAGAAGSGTIDPNLLLPTDRTLVRYSGSLTTPPCSESVRWHVMLNSLEWSHEQLAAFTARFPHSNRPVQPRNVRDLEVLAG